MKTMAEMLTDDAENLKADIQLLLGNHSRLRMRPQNDTIVVISPSGDHTWEKLSMDGLRIQAKLLTDYRKYRELVSALVRGLPGEAQREFSEADDLILKHVEQERATWSKTPQEAAEETVSAFDRIEEIVNRLYSPDGAALAVPDTNALLARPDLDHWQFDWCASFTIILTPTVLAELDELKVSHRNPDVRAKAESVIRRIKELGRRGDLHNGVPVVKDRIEARSMAVEPQVRETLPWLDPNNNDDRLLASVVELIRENVRSVVAIVTGDINLQNKARFARIAFCEVPTAEEAPSG